MYDVAKMPATERAILFQNTAAIHQEAFRPESSNMPARYSRHYYDIYCMAHRGVLEEALADCELLNQVSRFKMKFYPRKWAQYEAAHIGTLKLLPATHSIPSLKADYEKMKAMFFGAYPSFDELLAYIAELEDEINSKEIHEDQSRR